MSQCKTQSCHFCGSHKSSHCATKTKTVFFLVLNWAIGLQSSLILRIIIITWKISSERDGMIAWYFEAETKLSTELSTVLLLLG